MLIKKIIISQYNISLFNKLYFNKLYIYNFLWRLTFWSSTLSWPLQCSFFPCFSKALPSFLKPHHWVGTLFSLVLVFSPTPLQPQFGVQSDTKIRVQVCLWASPWSRVGLQSSYNSQQEAEPAQPTKVHSGFQGYFPSDHAKDISLPQ